MTDNTQPEAMDLADWLEAVGGGPSAKRCAALLREQHARIAELESELEAMDAGGVQALSAAPEAFLKSVIALCSHRGYSPANIEAWDKNDKWIADLWRQAEAMLAASPTAQAADSVLEDAMAWPKPGPQNPTWTICPKFLEKIMRSSASEYMPGLEEIEAVLLGLRTLFSASRVDLPGWESWPPDAHAADSVQEDAARYRWLRENWFTMTSNYQRCITFKVGEPRWSDITEEELDAAIDAALAAQGGKCPMRIEP